MLHDPEFWVAVAFFCLIGVFIYFKVPAVIAKALDERSDKIKQDIDRAAKLKADAKALFVEYQRKQRNALKEAEEIIAHAKAEAARLAQEAEAELQASLERRRALAEAKIAQAEAQAVKEVREAAVDLALAAARRIIAGRLEGAKADTLVDQAIADVGRKLH